MLRQQSDILKHYALVHCVLFIASFTYVMKKEFMLSSTSSSCFKPMNLQGLPHPLCHFLVRISASQTTCRPEVLRLLLVAPVALRVPPPCPGRLQVRLPP